MFREDNPQHNHQTIIISLGLAQLLAHVHKHLEDGCGDEQGYEQAVPQLVAERVDQVEVLHLEI